VGDRSYCGQLVDLNMMPQVHADGSWNLIIGSGYLFVGLYPFQGNRQPGIPLSDPIAEQRQAQIGLAEELVLRAFMQVSMSLSICPRRGASGHGHRTIANCAFCCRLLRVGFR
jgi:hypothetical protein